MADCAAHLVDRVMPPAPYRQWTLSLPYDVRLRIGYDKKLLGQVLTVFLRTIFRWQRLQARRAGISYPQTGAVTLCQRFGSILQFTPHFHSWLPDGVWSDDGQGGLQFHRLPPPSDQEVDTLLYAVAKKVDALLSTTDDDAAADDDTGVMRDAQQHAVQSPLPTVRRPWATAEIRPRKPRCAMFEGYSPRATRCTLIWRWGTKRQRNWRDCCAMGSGPPLPKSGSR